MAAAATGARLALAAGGGVITEAQWHPYRNGNGNHHNNKWRNGSSIMAAAAAWP